MHRTRNAALCAARSGWRGSAGRHESVNPGVRTLHFAGARRSSFPGTARSRCGSSPRTRLRIQASWPAVYALREETMGSSSPAISSGSTGSSLPSRSRGRADVRRTSEAGETSEMRRVDPRRGFEPRLTESESVVLPLDDRGSGPEAGLYRTPARSSRSARKRAEPAMNWQIGSRAGWPEPALEGPSTAGQLPARPV